MRLEISNHTVPPCLAAAHLRRKPFPGPKWKIPMSYMISNMAPQHEASYEEQRQCPMVDVNDRDGFPSTKGP
ncbi:unnamed protein product [Citrullus colocynthis]|uniref:Uncharacterized protein n=1 Tax=Citrullus colocynthis TaxID=252529 RepID=A0ABP0Z9J6_9ROSI